MKRLLSLALLALALLLVSMAPRDAKADPFEGEGYIWGPNGNWMQMREPLNHGAVFKAITMAVDSNAISQRLLGQPHMLFSVEDASPQAVVSGGTDVSDPDNARQLLADDGVTSLAFTIAGDPDTPPTMQLAEAIAADLKTNLGADVEVTSDTNADYIVRAAAQPAPPADLPFTYTCTPDSFRPGIWVPVECDFEITNNGPAPVEGVEPFMSAFAGEVVPRTFAISETANGQLISLDEVPAQYGQTLQPGETLRLVDLSLWLFDGEGDGNASWIVNAGGKRIAAGQFPYHASADASQPQDLEVTRNVMGNEDTKLWYRTTVTNRGSSAISDLRLTERYSGTGDFQTFVPPPTNEQADFGLATLDLSAFGKSSLAPGESASVETWYIPPLHDDGCPFVDAGMLVEATVSGSVERYGARTQVNPLAIQPCNPPADDSTAGTDGRGGSPAASLTTAGQGPSSSRSGPLFAAEALAATSAIVLSAAATIRLIGRGRARP